VLYLAQGKYKQAELLLRRALAIREQMLGSESPRTAITLAHLARLSRDQGKYAEAESLFQRALTIREKTLGPEHPDTAATRKEYSDLVEKMKQTGETAQEE